MRFARQKPKKPPQSESLSLAAPVGGLNARDALAAMPPLDAVILDNFFPSTTSVDLRRGFSPWSTGYTDAIESLMTYNSPTTSKLFAASGTSFFDATAGGVVGAAVVTGLANARWQYTNMGTPGGQFLLAVNGADYPEIYTGTVWQKVASVAAQTISTITRAGTLATLTTAAPHGLSTGNYVTVIGTTPAGFSGTYMVTVTGASTFTYVMAADPGANASVVGTYVTIAITGVDPRLLIHVNLYASRVFFIEKDSARFWYLPVNTVTGAALSVDLSPLLSLGGYLMAMATWTIDNAAGVQEYAVFISSEGEVLMYSGTDPAVAANWVKNGRYRIGRPVGRRCFVRVASDVIFLTSDGFLPLSKALLTDRTQQIAISDKINTIVAADLDNYGDNFGWEACLAPVGNKLFVNVPTSYRSPGGGLPSQVQQARQYVMNTITGAWCRYIGWNASTFESMGDELFFASGRRAGAGTAYVAKCEEGFSDNGGYIFGEAKTAFQYFGAPGYEKQITMARPVFKTSGTIRATLAMDMDFADAYPVSAPSFSGTGGTPWNTAPWNTFPWGESGSIKQDWQGVVGVGDTGALHMRVVNNVSALQWQSVQYVFRRGRIL